jgi:uncharacterized membrane protein
MRKLLPWVLFGASLIVNAMFIGGALFGHGFGHWNKDREAAFERVVEKLDLTDEQEVSLMSMREGLLDQGRDMHDQRTQMRRAMLDELRGETFDEARFVSLMEEGGERRRAFFLELARRLHAFMGDLSEDQRERLLEMIEDRRFRRAFMSSGRHRSDR